MSDNVLSIIPTDPWWQPERTSGERAAALVSELATGLPDDVEAETDTTWHDALTVVDCGSNLERISCPHCRASIDTEWWADLLEDHDEDGFATPAADVPCCGTATSLDVLEYDWPCGFARFEIAVWNPERDRFTAEELARIGAVLGHPVRQIRAHI
jgi:hypothetical protein